MKKRTIKIIALVALANLLVFGSCIALVFWGLRTIPFGDAFIGFDGVVYEWVNAPKNAVGKIYIVKTSEPEKAIAGIIEELSKDIVKVALEGAVIKAGEKEEVEKKGDKYILYEMKADMNGRFEYFTSASGKSMQLIIKVNKPGYIEVAGEASYDGPGDHYTIVALLVRNKN